MKIALFVHCFFPAHFYGTETYTFDLARHYRAWGHDVTVVTAIFQGEPRAPELISRYEYQGVPVIAIDKNHIPHGRIKETYYQSEMRGVLEALLRDLRPDVVHVTHLINHTAALLEVTGELSIPTYATFTDFFGFCLNNKLENAAGALCAGPSTSRTNCIACHLKAQASGGATDWTRFARSPGAAQALAEGANLVRRLPFVRKGPLDGLLEDIARRPDTLKALYNAGYKGAIAPTQFLKTAYEMNGIRVPMHSIWFGVDIERRAKPRRPSGHKPVLGFIGQIAPHKGTDLLIDAYRRLDSRAASMRIYGPADQDPAFMAGLRDRAGGASVQFLGTFPKERTAEVLRDIDLLVIPSRWYENSPLVLLNALASSTPVLVSDVAGMTEFVEEGVNGVSFRRNSVDSLHAALESLVLSPERLTAMSSTTHFGRGTGDMARDTFARYSNQNPERSKQP